MELLFGGAMVSLLVDAVGKRQRTVGRYGAGIVVWGALFLSLLSLAWDWSRTLGGATMQPVLNPLSSLYVADKFTDFAAFTVLVVGLAVVAYSLKYFDSPRQGPFYALFAALACSLVGVASAGDLLTLFLFWEGMAVSAYGLVTYGRAQLSLEAGIKYFLMAGVGSLFALYGIAAVYFTTGSLLLQSMTLAVSTPFGELGVVFLLLGLGVEAAVVPLHTWLPDVYAAAPIPTASIVSGAVTGVGVFALLKVLQPLASQAGGAIGGGAWGVQVVVASLALVTMVVGNLSALGQPNLRRMLSFSSIAQTGYMLAALSTLSLAGLVAVVFTIWNHGILKSNFFMAIGKEDSGLDRSMLENLRGKGRTNKAVGFVYASSSLAMTGAPPFGMFWSEILIVQSLLLAGQGSGPLFYLLAAAVVLNIVLSIGYYFRVINTVVFGDPQGERDPRGVRDLLPSSSLLVLSLVTGVAPFLILAHAL